MTHHFGCCYSTWSTENKASFPDNTVNQTRRFQNQGHGTDFHGFLVPEKYPVQGSVDCSLQDFMTILMFIFETSKLQNKTCDSDFNFKVKEL